MSDYIRVRDRRSPQQYSIHNVLIDEWFPIIGQTGYTLYSLYVRMANRENEKCWPSFRLIAKHLGIGNSTISEHNNLLFWTRLIHIEPGNKDNPNEYYILEVPRVTPAALDAVEQAARAYLSILQARQDDEVRKLQREGLMKEAAKRQSKAVGGKFYQTLFKRLDNWQPIQAIWGSSDEPETAGSGIHPAQLALFGCSTGGARAPVVEGGAPPVEQPAPGVEPPAPVVEGGAPGSGAEQSIKNNPKQTILNNTPTPTRVNGGGGGGLIPDILSWIGFNGRLHKNAKWDETWAGPDVLLGWAFWIKINQTDLTKAESSAVGIMRSYLRNHQLPNKHLLELARHWLSLDDYEKDDLLSQAWSASNVELWFRERALGDGLTDKFMELYRATNGDIVPPALMPADDLPEGEEVDEEELAYAD